MTPAKSPERVELTLANQRKVQLWNPAVVGDSIVGYSHRNGDVRSVRRAEAIADVSALSIKKRDDSFAAVLAVTAIVGALYFFWALKSMGGGGGIHLGL